MKLTPTSDLRLRGVHPDLAKVVRKAAEITTIDFIVTCGKRTVEEQRKLFSAGATRTMKSRHIPGKSGFACAVDLAATVDGKVRWDWPLYAKLAKAMKQAAKDAKVPLEWGGDWTSFKDGPHFQLPWSKYP